MAAIHLVSQQSDTRRARTKQNKQASAKMHGVFGWFLEWFLEWFLQRFPDRFPDGFKEAKKAERFKDDI